HRTDTPLIADPREPPPEALAGRCVMPVLTSASYSLSSLILKKHGSPEEGPQRVGLHSVGTYP
ncbi:MAG TPA: hypothetical protein VJQ79_08895, partial [Acidimicrobiia bacterium]|nr:hypothetical protein [Acidimicrobiia bacterium]